MTNLPRSGSQIAIACIFWVVIFHPQLALSAAPPCTVHISYYDCSYCAATQGQCGYLPEPDSAYTNKPVTNLPLMFSYSKTDPVTLPCGGSVNPANTCNGGTTSFSANVLPVPASSQGSWGCKFAPYPADLNTIPTTVTCTFRGSYCTIPCIDWVSQTCSYSSCY